MHLQLKYFIAHAFILLLLVSCNNGSLNNEHKKRNYTIFNIENFSISLPTGWHKVDISAVKSIKEEKRIYVFEDSCRGDGFCENIVIKAIGANHGYDLAEFNNVLMGEIKDNYDNYKLIKKYKIEINNIPMSIIDYRIHAKGYDLLLSNVFAKIDTSIIQLGITSAVKSDAEALSKQQKHNNILYTLNKAK